MYVPEISLFRLDRKQMWRPSQQHCLKMYNMYVRYCTWYQIDEVVGRPLFGTYNCQYSQIDTQWGWREWPTPVEKSVSNIMSPFPFFFLCNIWRIIADEETWSREWMNASRLLNNLCWHKNRISIEALCVFPKWGTLWIFQHCDEDCTFGKGGGQQQRWTHSNSSSERLCVFVE